MTTSQSQNRRTLATNTTTTTTTTTIIRTKTSAATSSSSSSASAYYFPQLWSQKLADDAIAKEDRLLVIGSGVAGSTTALIAAETYGIPVTLLFAGNASDDCNSRWAQGGIIYRNYDEMVGDSAQLLAEDIHRAGAGLCDDAAVQKVSIEGPDRVRQLLLEGMPYAKVPFDKRPNGELSLCLGTYKYYLCMSVCCCCCCCYSMCVCVFVCVFFFFFN
jgi:FAD binding domain